MATERRLTSDRLRVAALAAVFMTSLDISIVNVAVPTLAREMHADLPSLQWVLDGYILSFAALLLTSARLGRAVGGARLLRLGIAAFAIASLACSLAQSIGVLIAARVAQGMAASLVLPSALAVTTRRVGDEKLGRELGLFSAAVGAATALGPALGALLIAHTTWRAIFWINVPIGVATWLLAGRRGTAPPCAAPARRPAAADVLLSSAGLFGLSYGLIAAGRHGWGSGRLLATMAVALVLLAVFAAVQLSRGADALVNLRLLARAPIAVGNGAALMTFSAMMGATFLAPLVMVGLYGYSLSRMAAALSCTSLLVLAVAPVSGRGVERFGPVPLLVAGSAIEAGALWSFGGLGLAPAFGAVMLAAAALGTGLGLTLPPLTVMAMSGTRGEEAYDASGLFTTSRQVGLAVGVAAFGSLASATVSANLHDLGGPASGLSIADLAVRRVADAPGAGPIRLAVWNGVAPTFHFAALTALTAALPALALALRRRGVARIARVGAEG